MGVLLAPDGAPAPRGAEEAEHTEPRLPPSPPAAPGHLLPSPLTASCCPPHRCSHSAPLPRPGPPRLGTGPCQGEGSGPRCLLGVPVGVRLFYFCVFLPPLPLSCRLAPCSSAPSCTCHLPALQPADERSWVYSPLHYSTQAPPASDGESDTVSVPTARQPGPADAPRTDGESPSGAGGQARPPPRGGPRGVFGPAPSLHGTQGPGPGALAVGPGAAVEALAGERAGWPLPVAPSPTLLPSAVIAVRSPTLSAAPAATLATSWRRCPPSSARDTGGAARPRWTSHAHALP